MITLTMRACVDAAAGLGALAKYPFPLAFGMRVARLRYAVQLHVDQLNEAQQERILQGATVVDGKPVIERNESGALVCQMTPAAQYAVEMERQEALRETVDVDAAPLTFADIPSTVNGEPTQLPPEILIALGPLLVG